MPDPQPSVCAPRLRIGSTRYAFQIKRTNSVKIRSDIPTEPFKKPIISPRSRIAHENVTPNLRKKSVKIRVLFCDVAMSLRLCASAPLRFLFAMVRCPRVRCLCVLCAFAFQTCDVRWLRGCDVAIPLRLSAPASGTGSTHHQQCPLSIAMPAPERLATFKKKSVRIRVRPRPILRCCDVVATFASLRFNCARRNHSAVCSPSGSSFTSNGE